MGRSARGSEGAPPATPIAPLTHPVRLSALAALDIQQAREWHDAREPGLGDQFLQRVNETMTRIGQNPHQYPTIIEDVRRANRRQFKYGVWYPNRHCSDLTGPHPYCLEVPVRDKHASAFNQSTSREVRTWPSPASHTGHAAVGV